MKTTQKLLTLVAAAGIIAAPTTAIADPSHKSTSPPFWTFVPPNLEPPPAGKTELVRTRNGLTAQFKTTGLTAGNVVTLWIMFFNNPQYCLAPGNCNPNDDIGRQGVNFDFHYAGGHIVNGANTTLSGHVRVGELSTSGWAELGEVGLISALMQPLSAQVILAIHDHGPAQTGQTLAAQLSSYVGGCDFPFLGDASGFAESRNDLPDAAGECSTIQVAFHNP